MKLRLSALVLLLTLLITSVSPAAAQAPTKDIVDIAAGDANFSTLVTAVQAAGLAETLKGTGPFTVFAPTNAAFEKLPAGTLDALLKDKAALTKVLTYHVVAGKVAAADAIALDGKNAKTVQGEEIAIKVVDGKVMINNATVTTADIQATNGVIHVIDTVILPPSLAAASTTAAPTTMPVTGGDSSFPFIPAASALAGLGLIGAAYVLRPRAQ